MLRPCDLVTLHHALNAECSQLAVQHVTGRSGFVRDMQSQTGAAHAVHQLANGARVVGNAAVAGRGAILVGYRFRDRAR